MRTNQITDSFNYLWTLHAWTTVVFDLLLLAGILIACLVYARRPDQRSLRNVLIFVARVIMGSMWWQQVIWKTPPTYGGLEFWTREMFKYAWSGLQRDFLSHVVLAHFRFFAPQIFLVEVLISVCLLLGVWSRFGSFLGFAMGINLSLGLYRSPSEWPWTYVFLILVMGLFVIDPPGRSLGLDVLLKRNGDGGNSRAGARLLPWLS